jgi:hypothetical protein
MRRFARTVLLVLFAVGTVMSAAAQQDPRGVLEYFDDPFEITVTDADGFEYVDIYIGYTLQPGDTIKTGAGTAEIRLDPNGSVIKLAENTEFTLDSLQGVDGQDTNGFFIAAGRVRTIAARFAGAGYTVRTPTSVGGVRGTDFINEVGEGIDLLAVRDGLVEFTKSATGQSVQVAAGQLANTFAETFQSVAASAEQLGELFNSMEFQQATPPPQETTQDTTTEDDTGDDEPADEPSDVDVSVEQPADDEQADDTQDGDDAPATVAPTVVDAPQDQPEDTPADGDGGIDGVGGDGDGPMDALMAGIAEVLALEIGSIALEGETYGKLVAQPQFQLGNLSLGLYLPVIYSGNLFDTDDWYHPAGNDEWSFGMDQDWQADPLAGLADLAGDLALKIKYIEWGQRRDPFFFKVGNLSNLTIGHGLLMRTYANDTDFPAVRRVGFNIGIDREAFGFETVVNDLAAPEIFGARIYARPAAPQSKLAVGLSGAADIAPASTLPDTAEDGTEIFVDERTADPVFLNVAVDLDLPIIEREAATAILFADAGGLLPYLRSGVGTLEPGMQLQALLHEKPDGTRTLRNYGIASGILGNLLVLDYRLEFRNYRGTFKPGFYDANYDRLRGEYVRNILTYLQNPDDPAYDAQTLGVYAEAGFSLLEAINLRAGYMWPWTRDESGQIVIGDDDYLLASLDVEEGLIPLDISAGVTYERTSFVPTLLNKDGFESARLFDENTVLSGEIVYPVAPILDIVATVSTTVLRDETGAIQYEERSDGTLRPKFGPVISVETRMGF